MPHLFVGVRQFSLRYFDGMCSVQMITRCLLTAALRLIRLCRVMRGRGLTRRSRAATCCSDYLQRW